MTCNRNREFNLPRHLFEATRKIAAFRALSLVALVLLPVSVSNAELVTLASGIDLDSGASLDVVLDTDDGELYIIWASPGKGGDIVYIGNIAGNPSPDGQDTGLGPDQDTIDAAIEEAKKHGGEALQEVNPLNNPIGRGFVESGKVPGAEIDPWDQSAFLTEDFGAGGAGGFDPMVPIGEQIGKHKQQGEGKDDDDGEGDGNDKNETYHDITNLEPEIIDPPPIPTKEPQAANRLWDVPVANEAAPQTQKSFVLMGSATPIDVIPTSLGNSHSLGLHNSHLLNGALNRGAMTRGGATIRSIGSSSFQPR